MEVLSLLGLARIGHDTGDSQGEGGKKQAVGEEVDNSPEALTSAPDRSRRSSLTMAEKGFCAMRNTFAALYASACKLRRIANSGKLTLNQERQRHDV